MLGGQPGIKLTATIFPMRDRTTRKAAPLDGAPMHPIHSAPGTTHPRSAYLPRARCPLSGRNRRRANVCKGSDSEVATSPRTVCFTPISGHPRAPSAGLFGATSGHSTDAGARRNGGSPPFLQRMLEPGFSPSATQSFSFARSGRPPECLRTFRDLAPG
jgi:hypothetical protein